MSLSSYWSTMIKYHLFVVFNIEISMLGSIYCQIETSGVFHGFSDQSFQVQTENLELLIRMHKSRQILALYTFHNNSAQKCKSFLLPHQFSNSSNFIFTQNVKYFRLTKPVLPWTHHVSFSKPFEYFLAKHSKPRDHLPSWSPHSRRFKPDLRDSE